MVQEVSQPHIALSSSQTPPVVIVVGDPKRVEHVAQCCEKAEELAFNREYRTFKCTHKGQVFNVTSHGVGSAGAAICFEELIKNGAQVIIRAGTAGSLQPDLVKQGDLVICHAAAREDGVTERYVPKGFPAVSDIGVVNTLDKIAHQLNVPVRVGTSLTCDLFYASPIIPSVLETYSKSQIDIVEMEAATLLTIAKIHKVKAAAICAIDGCPLKWDKGDYDPFGNKVSVAKDKMIQIAIHAAVELSSQINPKYYGV